MNCIYCNIGTDKAMLHRTGPVGQPDFQPACLPCIEKHEPELAANIREDFKQEPILGDLQSIFYPVPPRYTSEKITALAPSEVFVFGSNLSGKHGAGAAKLALKWGAKWGVGKGHIGQTYALPTKDRDYRVTLPLEDIATHVDTFIEYAKENPQLIFLVTKIGCGLAGLKEQQVAPMFAKAAGLRNVILPESFALILGL